MTDARALAQLGDKNMTDLRQQIVTEIMSLVRQQPKKMEPRPTSEELEKMWGFSPTPRLNSETTDDIRIEPDGSVSVRPTVTTKVAALFQSALAAARNEALEEARITAANYRRWAMAQDTLDHRSERCATADDIEAAIRALKDRP